jgi:hypothetical protein
VGKILKAEKEWCDGSFLLRPRYNIVDVLGHHSLLDLTLQFCPMLLVSTFVDKFI